MIDADFPTSLQAFQNRFSDEETCLDYLRGQKWPEGPKLRRKRSIERMGAGAALTQSSRARATGGSAKGVAYTL
jgi:hypothetical protein